MPNPFFSHQTPTLLIKMKYPKWIDGTAICLGAFAPDLGIIIEPFMTSFPFRYISHSFLGLLIWVAPIAILLTVIFSRYIGPRISKLAMKEGRISKLMAYFGFDELRHLKEKQFGKHFYFVAFYSAFIGGLTHLLLDFPSHPSIELFFPWAVFSHPEFLFIVVFDFGLPPIIIDRWQINSVITLFELIWYIEDTILLGISLFLLRKIKNESLMEKWYENENLNKVQA